MALKVLIVEDNPVARSFLCRVVRESFSDTIVIAEAGDLESARRQIGPLGSAARPGEEAFKLILVDLELPDGNGMELLAELVRYPATKIVTTLYSDDDHLFPALQCGADGYLLKEDRFEVLVEELQKIVRGQPPLSPAIARRLLSHFRGGPSTPGADTAPAPLASPFQSSRPSPLSRGVSRSWSSGFSIGTGRLVVKPVACMKPESGAPLSPPARKCVSSRRAMAGESGGWPRTIFCSSSTSTSKRSSFSR